MEQSWIILRNKNNLKLDFTIVYESLDYESCKHVYCLLMVLRARDVFQGKGNVFSYEIITPKSLDNYKELLDEESLEIKTELLDVEKLTVLAKTQIDFERLYNCARQSFMFNLFNLEDL